MYYFSLLIYKIYVMGQIEDLERVTAFAEQLGLPFDQIVHYWYANEKFNFEQVVKTQLALSQQVKAGMFVAPDNRIYRGMPEGGSVKGVIGMVEPEKALAVCLTQKSLCWSSDYFCVPETRTMTSGLEATHKILETAWKEGKKAEAAEWCINYSEYGVKPGEAFLPSMAELKRLLIFDQAVLNRSLNMLGGGVRLMNDYYAYLSSNEESKFYVRTSLGIMSKNTTYQSIPFVSFVVRPVFWVDLKKVEFI